MKVCSDWTLASWWYVRRILIAFTPSAKLMPLSNYDCTVVVEYTYQFIATSVHELCPVVIVQRYRFLLQTHRRKRAASSLPRLNSYCSFARAVAVQLF